jgi:hypothetical protein
MGRCYELPSSHGLMALMGGKAVEEKRLSRNYSILKDSRLRSVLRIRDVYPGSRILIFTHPGSRISDPGSRIQKQQQKGGVKKN